MTAAVLLVLLAAVLSPLPGSGLRQLLLAVAIVAGVVVALATLPEAHAWSHRASLQRQFGDN